MIVTLLILILATLLFGAAAIRGAIAKVFLIASLAIAVTLVIAWLGDDGFIALLCIGLVLLVGLGAFVQYLDWRDAPKSPLPNQHTYVPAKRDRGVIKFSDRTITKAEKKEMRRKYRSHVKFETQEDVSASTSATGAKLDLDGKA